MVVELFQEEVMVVMVAMAAAAVVEVEGAGGVKRPR